MKFPRPRLSVRMMIGLVAVAAVSFWAWRTYLDPVRLWREAIRDKYDMNRRAQSIHDGTNGRVPGITPDLAIAEYAGLMSDGGQDPQVRMTAASGLSRFKEKARVAIPALVAAVRDESPGVRISAVVSIRQILGDDPADDPIRRGAVAGLVAALKDPDRRVRRWSACTLGWIGEGEVAIPALVEALKQPDLNYMERMQVLNALGRSGPKAVAAVSAVLEMVAGASIDGGSPGDEVTRRGNAEAQIQAAKFLHAFGEAGQAVEILRRLAKDRDPLIAAEAAKVLSKIELIGPAEQRSNPGTLEP